MILSNPHIRFYLLDGELRPAVVIVPEDFLKVKAPTIYSQELEQALANPIYFKSKEDEARIIDLVAKKYFDSNLMYQLSTELPYTIEGEIEIREVRIFENAWDERANENYSLKQFVFLKTKEKDVFDTGARLPEQKEESQIDLWREVLEIQENNGGFTTPFVDVIQSKFTIHRKP